MATEQGSLSTIRPKELFNELMAKHRVGMLTITRYQQVRIMVWTRTQTGIENQGIGAVQQLGEILKAREILDENSLQKALNYQRSEPGKKLGEVLISRGMVKKEDINEIIRFQMTEQLIEILTWRDADFEFTDEGVEKKLEDFPGLLLPNAPTKLLAEAFRKFEGWDKLERRLPSPFLVFKETPKAVEKSGELSDNLRRFLRFIHEGRTLETIVQLSIEGRLPVYRQVIKLLDEGFILPAPVDDLKFLASEHRVRKRFVDALNIYRRLLQVTSDPDEQRELEKSIYETIEAVEVGRYDGVSKGGSSTKRVHKRASAARRRRKVKQYSMWFLFGSLLLFFFVFIILGQYRSASKKKSTEKLGKPALNAKAPPAPAHTRVDALQKLFDAMRKGNADTDFEAMFRKFIPIFRERKPAAPTRLFGVLGRRSHYRKVVENRLKKQFIDVIAANAEFAMINKALMHERQKPIPAAVASMTEEKKEKAIAGRLEILDESAVYRIMFSCSDKMELSRIREIDRKAVYEMERSSRERAALMELVTTLDSKMKKSLFEKSLQFNIDTCRVLIKNAAGRMVPAKRILNADFLAIHWRNVGNNLIRLRTKTVLRVMARNLATADALIAEAEKQFGGDEPDYEAAEVLWRRALLFLQVPAGEIPEGLAGDSRFKSLLSDLGIRKEKISNKLKAAAELRTLSSTLFDSAVSAEAAGDLDAAENIYKKLVAKWPEHYAEIKGHWAAVSLERNVEITERRHEAQVLFAEARAIDPRNASRVDANPQGASMKYQETVLRFGDIIAGLPSPVADTKYHTAADLVLERIRELGGLLDELNRYIESYRKKVKILEAHIKRLKPDDRFERRKIDGTVSKLHNELENLMVANKNARGFLVTSGAPLPVQVESRPEGAEVRVRELSGESPRERKTSVITPGYLMLRFGWPVEVKAVRNGWVGGEVKVSNFDKPSSLRLELPMTPVCTRKIQLMFGNRRCKVTGPPAVLDDGTLLFPTRYGLLKRVRVLTPGNIRLLSDYPVPAAIGPMFRPVLFETTKGRMLVVATTDSLDFFDPESGAPLRWSGWSRSAGRVRGLGKAQTEPVVYESYRGSGMPYAAWVNDSGQVGVVAVSPASVSAGKPLMVRPRPAGMPRALALAPVKLFPVGADKLVAFTTSRNQIVLIKRTNPENASQLLTIGATVLWAGRSSGFDAAGENRYGSISFHSLADVGPGLETRFLAAVSEGMSRKVVIWDLNLKKGSVEEKSEWLGSISLQSVSLLTDTGGEKFFAVAYGKDSENEEALSKASPWRQPKSPWWIMLLKIRAGSVLAPLWSDRRTIIGRPLPPVSGRMFGREVIFVVTAGGRLYVFDPNSDRNALLVDGAISLKSEQGVKFAFPSPGGGLGIVTSDDEILFFYK